MSRPRRVIGYARVSSAEQALGTSLGDQQEAIRAYAALRELTVAKIYVEAESAIHEKIERREQMLALMSDVREGDLVLCAKLDRWSRDPEFAHGSVKRILGAGAHFYSIDERCDPSSSEGDTMLGFRILFAREEHKRIKERMVGTRRLLRERGYYTEGRPPIGYRRAHPPGHRGVEKNVLVVEPDGATVVRSVFALYVGGLSMGRTGAALGLRLDTVKEILARRVYCGQMQTSGGWIDTHEPIVPIETFLRARELAAKRRLGGARPRNTPARTSGWILRDVATCAICGARMTAAYGNDPEKDHYYRCSKKCQTRGARVTTGSFVRVGPCEAQAAEMVIARLRELRLDLGKPSDPPIGPRVDFSARRAKLQRRRVRLLELFADDGIGRPELRDALGKVDAEQARLDDEEAATRRPAALDKRAALAHIEQLEKAWRKATGPLRRKLVNDLAESFALRTGASPAPKWRALRELLVEVNKS